MRGSPFVIAALAVVPSAASAQPQPPAFDPQPSADRAAQPPSPVWARSQTNRVGVEIDYWSARAQFFDVGVSILAVGFTPVAQLRLVDDVYVVAEVPLGLTSTKLDAFPKEVSVSHDTTGAFTAGNPTLGAYWGKMVHPRAAILVGGTVTVPTIFGHDAYAVSNRGDTVQLMAKTRAYADLHRWAPERLPIRLLGSAEIRIMPNLYYRGDIAPALYAPLGALDTWSFFIDQGNDIEVRCDMGLGGGLRFQEAILANLSQDRIQTAVEAFAAYEPPEEGVYGRLGFLVALDETFEEQQEIGGGFGFDEGKLATLRATVGGTW